MNRWNRMSILPYRIICRKVCTKETKRWQSICEIRIFVSAGCTPKKPNINSYNMCKKWKSTVCTCTVRFGCVKFDTQNSRIPIKLTFRSFHLQNVDNNVAHDVYVAISLNGIAIFERCSRINAENQVESGTNSRNKFQRKLYANFDWLEIDNLCFSKHSLCVVVRKAESLKAKDNNKVKYKFKMDGRKWVRISMNLDFLAEFVFSFLFQELFRIQFGLTTPQILYATQRLVHFDKTHFKWTEYSADNHSRWIGKDIRYIPKWLRVVNWQRVIAKERHRRQEHQNNWQTNQKYRIASAELEEIHAQWQ